jgi:hypothetical protein
VTVRSVFPACGLASFVFLVHCSAFSGDKAGGMVLVSGIVLNVVPIFAAIVLFMASFWYQFRLMPIIIEIEDRFERYKDLLNHH